MLNALIFAFLCLIWGSTWLAIKIGLEGSPPFLGAGFRFAIAAAFLFALSVFTGGLDPEIRRKWRGVVFAAFVIYPIPYGLVYWGSQYIESGMAAVLFAVMPFFVAILAHARIQGEKLTVLKILGMLLGFGGILVIFADNLGARGSLGIIGMVAVSGSAFFSAVGTVYSKKHFHEIDPISLTAFQSMIGAIVLTAVGLAFESLTAYRFDARTLGSLLYLGILGTAATFTLYFYVLKRMEATKLATIAFITPVVAMILGIALRGERFDFASVVGSFMVIAGVFIVVAGGTLFRGHTRSRPRAAPKARPGALEP